MEEKHEHSFFEILSAKNWICDEEYETVYMCRKCFKLEYRLYRRKTVNGKVDWIVVSS